MAITHDLGLDILEHRIALRRYAFSLMRSADQADDLVQDCIARALGRAHLYRPDTNLRAWLFTILRNIFVSQIRAANHRRRYASDYLATESDVALPNQFHSVVLEECLKFMAELPVPQRQAVVLLGFSDMSYEEAAQHSGIKVGTMKSRASRGRMHLRLLSAASAKPV